MSLEGQDKEEQTRNWGHDGYGYSLVLGRSQQKALTNRTYVCATVITLSTGSKLTHQIWLFHWAGEAFKCVHVTAPLDHVVYLQTYNRLYKK